MEIALLIAFILNNAAWLVFFSFERKEGYRERFTLLERIMRPDFIPSEPIPADDDLPVVSQEEIQARKEYAAVGDVGEFDRS